MFFIIVIVVATVADLVTITVAGGVVVAFGDFLRFLVDLAPELSGASVTLSCAPTALPAKLSAPRRCSCAIAENCF